MRRALAGVALLAALLPACTDVKPDPTSPVYFAPSSVSVQYTGPAMVPGLTYVTVAAANMRLGEWLAAVERAAPVAPHPQARPARHQVRSATPRRSAPSTVGTGRCGGDLPPCYIMQAESGGSLTARNPSGAAGKWQIMPGTWNGYGGYSSADQAPESVQDERARQIWNGGRGCSAWTTC